MLKLTYPNYDALPFDPFWLYALSRDVVNVGYVYYKAKDAQIEEAMRKTCKFYNGWDEDGTGWTRDDTMIAMCDYIRELNKQVNKTEIDIIVDSCGFEVVVLDDVAEPLPTKLDFERDELPF